MSLIDTTTKKFNEGKEYLRTKKEQLTGKAIEHKIDEYSEIYGEILLGMDRELSEVKTKINKIDECINVFRNKNNGITYSDYQKIKWYLILSITLSLAAIIVALIL